MDHRPASCEFAASQLASLRTESQFVLRNRFTLVSCAIRLHCNSLNFAYGKIAEQPQPARVSCLAEKNPDATPPLRSPPLEVTRHPFHEDTLGHAPGGDCELISGARL